MDEDDLQKPPRRLIDEATRHDLLNRCAPGRAARTRRPPGFPLGSLYNVRARDPVFRLAWEWALDLAAIDERGGALSRAPPRASRSRIAPTIGRLLQRQPARWVQFTDRRQQIYLDHFAGTANAEAAAAAAGVTCAAVRAHCRKHPSSPPPRRGAPLRLREA